MQTVLQYLRTKLAMVQDSQLAKEAEDPWEHYAKVNSAPDPNIALNRAKNKASQQRMKAEGTGLYSVRKYDGIFGASREKKQAFGKAYRDYTNAAPGADVQAARLKFRDAHKSMRNSAYLRRGAAGLAGAAALYGGYKMMFGGKKDHEKEASDRSDKAIMHGAGGALAGYFGTKGFNKAVKEYNKAQKRHNPDHRPVRSLSPALMAALGATAGGIHGYVKGKKKK